MASNGIKLIKEQRVFISIGAKTFRCTEIIEEILNISEEVIDLTKENEEPASPIIFEPTTPDYEVTDCSPSYSFSESPTSPGYEPMSPSFSPPSSPSSTSEWIDFESYFTPISAGENVQDIHNIMHNNNTSSAHSIK